MPGAVGAETPHTRSTWWEQRLTLPVSWKISDSHTATLIVADVISKPGYEDPDGSFFDKTKAQSLQLRAGRRVDFRRQPPGRIRFVRARSRSTAGPTSVSTSTASARRSGDRLRGHAESRWWSDRDRRPALRRPLAVRPSPSSPRGTISWLSQDGFWKLRGSGGTGFPRPVDRRALLSVFQAIRISARRSTSFEVGAERYLSGGRVEASLFWNDYRDLIVYDFTAFQDLNVGRARHARPRARVAAGPRPGLFAEAGYTYLDAEDRDNGPQLIRRPQHRGFLSGARGRSWAA